jgi:hypothetical protein
MKDLNLISGAIVDAAFHVHSKAHQSQKMAFAES